MRRRFTTEEARAAGAKGGTISGQRRWQQSLAKLDAVWPHMPHAAMLAIRAYGLQQYRSGWRARDRRAA